VGYRRADYQRDTDPKRWVYIEAPAIVDAVTWDRCQERFAENREMFSGRRDRRYLLSGLLRCPLCRKAMKAQRRAEQPTLLPLS
jgi:site-specific DNA recombinase